MLQLTRLRELNLATASDPSRPAYISAASGLVTVSDHLYVVADDELFLGHFALTGDAPGNLLRMIPGELPEKKKERKKHKPDFEVLLRLPKFAQYEHGALLAMGSGSTDRRYRAVLLPLSAGGEVDGVLRIIEASAFYEVLAHHFEELNLEGGWVQGNELRLLQRGNKAKTQNAVIHLDLHAVLNSLIAGDSLPAIKPLKIHSMDLGQIDKVPLCFSDGCALPDGRWLFTAVAEDTDSAYEDGECVGAAVGMVDANDHLVWSRQVAPSYKIEGIEARQEADGIHLLLVSDADDINVPSCLFAAVV
jgi:hypothetical protein